MSHCWLRLDDHRLSSFTEGRADKFKIFDRCCPPGIAGRHKLEALLARAPCIAAASKRPIDFSTERRRCVFRVPFIQRNSAEKLRYRGVRPGRFSAADHRKAASECFLDDERKALALAGQH